MDDDKPSEKPSEKSTGSTALAQELTAWKNKYGQLLALLTEVQNERDLARQTLQRMSMDINKVTDVAERLKEIR